MQLPALAIQQQPDLGVTLGNIATLKGATLQNKLLEAKMARESKIAGLRSDVFGGGAGGQVAGPGAPTESAPGTLGGVNMPALQKMMEYDPEGASAIVDSIGKMNKFQAEQARRGAEGLAKLVLPILKAPPEQRPLLYAQTIGKMQASGQQFKNPPPAQYDEQWLNARVMEALTMDQVLSQADKAREAQKPLTGIGKLEADLRAGRITKQQYDQQVAIDAKPLVQLNNTQETERSKAYGKEVGKYYGESYTKLQEGATSARSMNANLDQLEGLLGNVTTGTAAEQRTKLTRAARTLGMDVSVIGDLGSAEAAQAITNEMALQLRNPAGGAGMPGAMSDSDRQFLQTIPPGIGKSAEGNKLLISARRKVNKRSIAVAKMAREYQRKHGALDAGFEDELQVYAEENPLFTKDDFAKAKAAGEDTSAPGALPPVDKRVVGQAYDTPRGKAIWRGKGWELQ